MHVAVADCTKLVTPNPANSARGLEPRLVAKT
ncbi:hypothetical protein LepocDRAFT_00000140 [Leptothrix ochracea L12]|uniref:Uncharacterized protein n=1 Tax=Leptothrix ochracea L12 TaxID=735332 RepID=I4Z4Z5_9BURK|nr:hypothetical protein LepocDRAFT_00000140 [Leptothrix ochracea L12]